MVFETGVHITIGKYNFRRCHSVKIERSAAIVQDTAEIKLPLTSVLQTEGELISTETARLFKPGDKVSIKLQYKNVYDAIEFRGYVKKIHPTQPLTVECEDGIYLLRQKNIKKSWEKTDLKNVLNEIVAGTGLVVAGNIPDINLEPFGLKNIDGAFALQKLVDEYGLRAYIKDSGELYCGLAFTENEGIVKYNINGETSNVSNANDLKWRSKDDIKIKVKAINIKKDNTKTEVEIGDKDGALRTLHFYNVKSAKELEKLAKQKLDELKFDGYEGKIKTKLIPGVLPGMDAKIYDSIFPARNGTYYVESVTTTFGQGGANREVELGIKI